MDRRYFTGSYKTRDVIKGSLLQPRTQGLSSSLTICGVTKTLDITLVARPRLTLTDENFRPYPRFGTHVTRTHQTLTRDRG